MLACSAALMVRSRPGCINRRCRSLKSIERKANLVSLGSFNLKTSSILSCTFLILFYGTIEARINLGSTHINKDVHGSWRILNSSSRFVLNMLQGAVGANQTSVSSNLDRPPGLRAGRRIVPVPQANVVASVCPVMMRGIKNSV